MEGAEDLEIVAYTVTENGLSGYLESTLSNLNRFCDAVLVSASEDSTDGTVEWCRQHEAVDHVITDSTDFPRELPQLRSRAHSELLERHPGADWLVALDDDEAVPRPGRVRQFLADAPERVHGVAARMHHMWEGDRCRVDSPWSPGEFSFVPFQNLDNPLEGGWPEEGPHCCRFPREGVEPKVLDGIPVIHLGWWEMSDAQRREKLEERFFPGRDDTERDRRMLDSLGREPELEPVPESWKSWIPRESSNRRGVNADV